MKTSSRRTFVKQSAAVVGGTLATPTIGKAIAAIRPAGAHGDETIRIALIGCGGRGTGAANQALSTAGKVELVAMADAFGDRLEGALSHLSSRHPETVKVPKERRFTGFDAYEKATASGVDLVILATPPGFRPIHFEHAIAHDKHVFMEKPVAVDAPGIRQVLAAGEAATRKGLKVGVGLQRHHSDRYLETVKRIHDGAIGGIRCYRAYWNGAGVWVSGRKANQTEMEYQMRNWYYFNWLCGDHIVEQHIHNLDVCNWIHGEHPVKAFGMGGREVRTGLDHGEIFDHHAVEYEYADGTRMFSQCRHIPGCWASVSEHVEGTLGRATVSSGSIETFALRGQEGKKWKFRGEEPNPYQVEHDELFRAIREDRPYNEARYGAESTMTAILGRMATYSGKPVTWKEAMASEISLSPEAYSWDSSPPTQPDESGRYPIPIPGQTSVIHYPEPRKPDSIGGIK